MVTKIYRFLGTKEKNHSKKKISMDKIFRTRKEMEKIYPGWNIIDNRSISTHYNDKTYIGNFDRFSNAHKQREGENDKKMAEASYEMFNSKSTRTKHRMEKQWGSGYYTNDGKWESDKTHWKSQRELGLTKNDRAWNNNFGNAQSLGSLNSLLANRAKQNLELYGKTHSGTTSDDLKTLRKENENAHREMIQYLKGKVKKSNKVNNNNNAKFDPNFGKGQSLITSPNQVEKGNWNKESQTIAKHKKVLDAIDVLEYNNNSVKLPEQQKADHNTEQNGPRELMAILLRNRNDPASFSALNNAINQALTQHRTQHRTQTNIAIPFNGKQYNVKLKSLTILMKALIRIEEREQTMPPNGPRSIDNGKQAKFGPNVGFSKASLTSNPNASVTHQGDVKYWAAKARNGGFGGKNK